MVKFYFLMIHAVAQSDGRHFLCFSDRHCGHGYIGITASERECCNRDNGNSYTREGDHRCGRCEDYIDPHGPPVRTACCDNSKRIVLNITYIIVYRFSYLHKPETLYVNASIQYTRSFVS